MALITGQDMSTVAAFGEALPEGWYRGRISEVSVEDSKNSPGEKTLHVTLVCQDEPHVGRQLRDFPSLKASALGKLKNYYKAIGYNPGPEGHDPDKLVGCEVYFKVEHEVYQGETKAKIPGYGIRAINDGPGK